MTANRPLYKKLKQREYREAPDHYKPLTPRPLTITVHKDGRAALRSAGIIPGATYTATPQPQGAILLTPTKEQDQ